MALFRNPNVSVGVCPQGMRADIWKNVGHIPNFVVAVASIPLMFYLFENKPVICFVEVLLMESKLLRT
jgi:hypothetical protein